MSEIYFAYLLGKNLPFLQLPYLYLVKQKKSVTKIMLATEYSSLRTPKKNTTKTYTSNHLPIIIHLSHHFSDSCGTPMAPSRNTWLKRIIASLSPLSADNFHHFTASRNLADWRKSSPKNLPNVTEGVFDDGCFLCFLLGGTACV